MRHPTCTQTMTPMRRNPGHMPGLSHTHLYHTEMGVKYQSLSTAKIIVGLFSVAIAT